MKTIAAAFVKAKRSFGPALKDKTNPAFRSKYADLGACIDAVEAALLDNGIAFIQETFEDATGVTVETVFLHESGESLRCGKLHVPASKQDPQGYGSALTYARRYSLCAACGIAPEDDDGEAAKKAMAAAAAKAAQEAEVNRTKVMQFRTAIQQHIVKGHDIGLIQDCDEAQEIGKDFYQLVWNGLTSPEREYIREVRGQQQKRNQLATAKA
jgi:hypothetical protein